ncbi:DUF4352 domain-containing protein [Actinoplanes sp. NPDC051859]|uniref:DUF4352 domain-containing protein n=1 Tax=Actinoplanes sp. NPDC051859 TaxID=3363909 RepID=UPI0037A4D140
MTAPGTPAAVSSSCSSCGAAMEVDQFAGVMRCPYCRREVPLPASQPDPSAWPFGMDDAGLPQITVTQTFTQVPVSTGRKLFVVAVALVALLAVGAVLIPVFSLSSFGLFGGTEEVEVGETATFDPFEATVHSIDCSRSEITKPGSPATETTTAKAKGKFCVVSFTVKNVGEKTDSYRSYSLEATSPTERVLDRNSTAEEYVNRVRNLDEPLDPGKSVDQLLVFDVPTDTSLARLKICDDIFNNTVIKVRFDS